MHVPFSETYHKNKEIIQYVRIDEWHRKYIHERRAREGRWKTLIMTVMLMHRLTY